MFDFIKRLFFKSKNIPDTSIITDIDKDIILINIAIDTATEEMGLFLDVHPYNIDDKKMIVQAEKLAHGLHVLCGDKVYLTKLILDNMDSIKKKSLDHGMFFDNVLFFWDHYLSTKPISSENDPLIRPSRVFKNS